VQGNIFFGNATLLAAEMEKLLLQPLNEDQVWFVILDFTLVVGIDSSAAETILKIFKLCRRCNVRLCYCAGAETGFPCAFPLSENIDALNAETVALKLGSCVRCGVSCAFFTEGRCIACGKKDNFTRPKWVCAASSLDSALRWCEDVILSEAQNGTRPGCVYGSCTHDLPVSADTGTYSGTNATLLTTAEQYTLNNSLSPAVNRLYTRNQPPSCPPSHYSSSARSGCGTPGPSRPAFARRPRIRPSSPGCPGPGSAPRARCAPGPTAPLP
jgi:hypothetical protein